MLWLSPPVCRARLRGCQHVMFEVESLDDVMRSYHHLRIHKAPIGMGPGRHINCHTVHVYVQTPGGFAVEFGWGHRRLDDATHAPVVYPIGSPVDIWGAISRVLNSRLGNAKNVRRAADEWVHPQTNEAFVAWSRPPRRLRAIWRCPRIRNSSSSTSATVRRSRSSIVMTQTAIIAWSCPSSARSPRS